MTNGVKNENLIKRWQDSTYLLKESKKCELELRNELLEKNFKWEGSNETKEGTFTQALLNNWSLKAAFGMTRSLKMPGGDDSLILEALDEISQGSPEGAAVAAAVIVWKPSIVKKEYDKMPVRYRAMLDKVITTKPSQPSLKIVEPSK